ncbi:Cyclin-like F-box [Cordyceps javanica]|uniref:Cyclin-like F-box n=1 Tax=Cordyceps javanica TaxID=43265 RepID=A0A545UND8_9HYPO|nr:Cyclin-like F-box [Cordyceps javanica]
MSSPEIDTQTGLPPEIKSSISQYLDNRDLKALRLTNSSFSASVTLRLPRVYLSLHPRDIAVFKAIADHPLRQQVTEIVYDNTRLPRLFPLSAEEQEQRRNNPLNNKDKAEEYEEINRLREVPHHEGGMPSCPVEEWYRERLRQTAGNARSKYNQMSPKRYPVIIERAMKMAARPNTKVSLGLYQKLYKQQVKTAEVDANIEALRYGIGCFPALKRIIITPAAHGTLYSPRYHTPTIHSLPFGLNYVLPRGWPYRDSNFLQYTPPWPRTPMQSLALLAQQPHLVPPELVFDVHGLNTGLNPHMLGQPSVDYNNLATVLERGLRRLDLPIIIGGLQDEG